MNRRRFLSTSAAVAALNQFPHHLHAGTTNLLGPKKIELSRLAMGTGTNGTGGVSGYNHGGNCCDTAEQYGTHRHARGAFKSVPSNNGMLLSKSRTSSAKEMRQHLDHFGKERNFDYINILLLPCMTEKIWNETKRGAMDVISVIRTKGVSCYTLDALKTSAAEPWVAVDLARINPAGIAMDDKDPKVVIHVLCQMKKSGKGVIGMKIFDKTDECLQFALSPDCGDVFTIGSESREVDGAVDIQDPQRERPRIRITIHSILKGEFEYEESFCNWYRRSCRFGNLG